MKDGMAKTDYQLGRRTLWAFSIPALLSVLLIGLSASAPDPFHPIALAFVSYLIAVPVIQIGLINFVIRYTHPDVFFYLLILFWINAFLVLLLTYFGFAMRQPTPDFNLDHFFNHLSYNGETGRFMIGTTYSFLLSMPVTGILWYGIFKSAISKKLRAT